MKRSGAILVGAAMLAGCATSAPVAVDPMQVVTTAGPVQAVERNGARIWYGIPYSAPPVGDLRWRAPQPAVAWDEVRTASEPGPPCAQFGQDDAGSFEVVGEEDCLTLNVYAPAQMTEAPAPVMVWIHGGGQYSGSGNAFDGQSLAARHGVIVVTVNYRLGPFGWFHHDAMRGQPGEAAATGQYALLDLIAALKWVRDNAEAFGGDPENVTIFGVSAGAQNVYALVLSEDASGLFDKAIAQSGGFWNMSLEQATNAATDDPPGTPASSAEISARWLVADGSAETLGEARRLQTDMPEGEFLIWAKGLSTADVLRPYADQPDLGYDMPSVVLDGALLPEIDHRAQLASGAYNRVPMIVGAVSNEQTLWQAFDPEFVDWSTGAPSVRHPDRYEAVDHYYTALWTLDAVDDFAARLDAPVFAYRFDWTDAPTEPVDFSFLIGAAHGLDVPFVSGDFSSGYQQLFTQKNAERRLALSEAMMSYWAAFAHFGDPGRGMNGDLPEWPFWDQARSKMVFAAGGPSVETSDLDYETVYADLLADARLTQADRCIILHHNSLYPALDRARLDAAGCQSAWEAR